MVKHKKTIKRQRNLQKQRGKGLCSSRPPHVNNSIPMSNLSMTPEGNLCVNIETNLKLVNRILDNIKSKSKQNQDDELEKVKKVLKITMKLKEIDVIKNDTEKYINISRELRSILQRIKALNESNA
jgi:hypothetical protein